MRLENFIALTRAELLNEPAVGEFNNIVFNPSLIKRGDVFVAFYPEDIEQAIANGAYGILSETDVRIVDDELAWLRVDSLEDALVRLLRFRLVEKNVTAYACDDVVLQLAAGVDTDGAVFVCRGPVRSFFRQLWDIETDRFVFFSSQADTARIFPNASSLSSLKKYAIEVIEKTLFEVSFIFRDTYYERVMLSPFFLPFLEELLNFYVSQKIAFRLKRFDHIKHFEIVFTDKLFRPKEHGSSEFVFIFEKDLHLLKREMDFLKTHTAWAETIYVLPESMRRYDYASSRYYTDVSEIFSILRSQRFHFALIGGVDKEILRRFETVEDRKQLTFDM